MVNVRSRWLSSLVAGALFYAVLVGAQVLQRPLNPNNGKTAGVTYFAVGSEPGAAADGEVAVRINPGNPPELVIRDGSTGSWVLAAGSLIASGSGTNNTLPVFDATGQLEDSSITENDVGQIVIAPTLSTTINGSQLIVDTTSLNTIAGDGGLSFTGGTGAGAVADIFLSADDNVNITAGDNIDLTGDTVTSAFTGLVTLESSGRVNLETVDAGAVISVDEARVSGYEIFIATTEANAPIAISATGNIELSATTGVRMPTTTQASLGTPANGTVFYCSDCNPDATCTAAGAGAFAFRINGAWACELN